jgi:hypothetical protein
MTAAPQGPPETRGSPARSVHLLRIRTWCHAADLPSKDTSVLATAPVSPQPNELHRDGSACIVGGAVLVRATTPTHT